ncbi:MAG: hypothetical protein ACOX6P_11540 [Candidatus Merdivicinus sp.]|jgi:hypothetical protein
MTLEEKLKSARQIHNAIRNTYLETEKTPTEIVAAEPLFDKWEPGKYETGDIRRHGDQIWNCVQPHDNANNPDIEPGKSPAQWAPFHTTDSEYAKPYIQPQGAHDAYMTGEVCIWEEKIYRCKADNTVWSPADYPDNWEEVV